MLEHCGITFSWEIEFGKGGPILAAKIGPGAVFGGVPIFSLHQQCLFPKTINKN